MTIAPSRSVYRLSREMSERSAPSPVSSTHSEGSSALSSASSAYSAENSAHSSASSAHSADLLTQYGDVWEQSVDQETRTLRHIAAPARDKHWLPRLQMRAIIVSLCRVRGLRLSEMAELLERSPASLRQQYLVPLIEEGQLRYLYQGEPTHPQQAYVAVDVVQAIQEEHE